MSQEIYKYLNITTEGLEGKISRVEFYFSVDKDWISETSVENVKLWRYHNGWEELSTEEIESTYNKVNYMAWSPGFSYFAIAGEKAKQWIQPPTTTTTTYQEITHVCGNGICEHGESYENCPEDCKEPSGGGLFKWAWAIALSFVILIIVVAMLIVRHSARRGKPSKPKPKIQIKSVEKPVVTTRAILTNPQNYIGKKVRINADVKMLDYLPEENMVVYNIRDKTGEIKGLSKKAGYEGQGVIEGILKKRDGELYIMF